MSLGSRSEGFTAMPPWATRCPFHRNASEPREPPNMSDEINARGSDSKFKPHEPGQFSAICCDVVDLGDKVESFQNQPAKLTHKCALVFITRSETGEAGEISREFTVSMGEKANLRKFLEQWRGRKYDQD